MTRISERRQHLDFDATWQVLKWDSCDEFRGPMQSALANLGDPRNVKGADAIAVRRRKGAAPIVLVGELKDFDHPSVPEHDRARVAAQAASDVILAEIVTKIIDSLCGATFAHDAAGRRHQTLDQWRQALGRSTLRTLVVYGVEMPPSQALAIVPLQTALKKRLRWLGPHARILITSAAAPINDVGVRYSVS